MSEHDARERFGLYRLCECPTCEGRGKVGGREEWTSPSGGRFYRVHDEPVLKCEECRGEGRIRQEVASCETAEAAGVALVTLGREGEWEGCAFGLLDRTPECGNCGGTGETLHDGGFYLPDCPECKGSGVKPTGDWLVLPWLPSARNIRDAARTLARSKKSNQT